MFGQIGFLFGYRSIYITAAASIFISMIVYLFIIRSEDKGKSI
ncbi:hypothetical protein RCO48_05025 [Peribacillus frigoritolerans]|nr:hypothetical protein [Peribacillus frigoritolerans]